MKVTIGKEGLDKTWQGDFPEKVECINCGGEARIAFVAHEAIDDDDRPVYPRDDAQFVCDLRDNGGEGDFWVHDCCAVAVYLCKECFHVNGSYNQA